MPLKTSTSSYLSPPVACERLDALLARFGGSYLGPETAEAAATTAANRVAHLPGGRVFGSGIVLAPDGSSVATDVSTDFGGPANSH